VASPFVANISMAPSGPQVFDGKDWIPVTESVGNTGDKSPVPPEEGDGSVFVVMPSFRGTLERVI
jgi:hypothetical protein